MPAFGHVVARLALLLAVVVAAGGACSETTSTDSTANTEPRHPVTTVSVGRGDVQELLETFGTVELDPERSQTLTALRSGRVSELRVVPGQVVKKGDVLLTLEAVPAGSLEVESARIELDFATRNLERVRRMSKLKLATNQELQAAEKQLANSRAVLSALGQDHADPLAVVSPSDGVVATRQVADGALVQPGQELLQVTPGDSMAIRVGFEVEEIRQLSAGLMVLVEPVFQGPDDAPVSARLSRLHRVADPKTQLVEGLIRLESPPSWAVPGTRARLQVVLQQAADVLRIPRGVLVSRSGDRAVVFVIDGNHARRKEISLGVGGAEWVEVREGLRAGQEVVEAGRATLTDGAAVRVAP